MKAATYALTNFLRSSAAFIFAELYTVTLVSGTVIRWTNGPASITYNGNTYTALGPLISRSRAKVTSKLEVSTMTVELKGAVLIGSTPLPAAASNGTFDGARINVVKLVMPTYGDTSLGHVEVFTGRVSSVEPSYSAVRLTVKSELETLNVAWPRNLIQPGCTNTLYGPGCDVNRAAYQVSGFPSSGTLNTVTAALGKPAGWFDLGVITFTSGALIGIQRTVKSWDGSTATLSLPLPVSPVGCAFVIVPGCDKTKTTCSNKFQNLAHFRGCPFVPKPESVR